VTSKVTKHLILINILLWVSLLHKGSGALTPGFMAYEDASVFFYHRNDLNSPFINQIFFTYPNYYPLWPLLTSYLASFFAPLLQCLLYSFFALLPAYFFFLNCWKLFESVSVSLRSSFLFFLGYWLHALEGNFFLNLSYSIWLCLFAGVSYFLLLMKGRKFSLFEHSLYMIWLGSNPIAILLVPVGICNWKNRNLRMATIVAGLCAIGALTQGAGISNLQTSISAVQLGQGLVPVLSLLTIVLALFLLWHKQANYPWLWSYLLLSPLVVFLLSPRASNGGLLTGRYLASSTCLAMLLLGYILLKSTKREDSIPNKVLSGRQLLHAALLILLLVFPLRFSHSYRPVIEMLRSQSQLMETHHFSVERVLRSNTLVERRCQRWKTPWHFCVEFPFINAPEE